jgi:hypothetical protein
MNSKSNAKCANCQEGGYECTYIENAKRRGPPKGYIETLEQRCGRLEKVLAQVSHRSYRDSDTTDNDLKRMRLTNSCIPVSDSIILWVHHLIKKISTWRRITLFSNNPIYPLGPK